MRDGLTFFVSWTDVQGDPTAARLRIDVAGNNACRVENHWSRSIDQDVHLSALPLAHWLAGSWWRLRWEAAPVTGRRMPSWRMAHELAAAGSGFLWPRLTFVSDGETLRVECLPTDPGSKEMLRYLNRFEAVISAEAFEVGVDHFMSLVLERLGGTSGHPLSAFWTEIMEERRDPELSRQRQFEASLGFDPDEAPLDLVQSLLDLRQDAGESAVAEIAAVCAGLEPRTRLSEVMALAEGGTMLCGRLARDLPLSKPSAALPSPERGRSLAHAVRQAIGLGSDAPVTDARLGELLGLAECHLRDTLVPSGRPLALMISDPAGRDRIAFRRSRPTSRRFEAARLLCDGLMESHDTWHPVSEADTARQKMQRAFAAEFLAPAIGIQNYLQGDFSVDAIEGAAEYFDVSSYAVGSNLANQGIISRAHPAVPAG